MKKMFILWFAAILSSATSAQTYLPITDNMVIAGNSNIKFAAGNYVIPDVPADGVIQISGVKNVVLDGDSCRVNGVGNAGYMIKITNAHNIVIKNFDSVFGYKYAVHIMNSDHITINGNVFCRNKVDSSGWIDVWADYTQALGGGVMMYQSRAASIHDNVMTMQNDGVALYHCDSISIHDNDFSWNTSFGIRMFWTDTCHIYRNNCAHVNRPLTDPSDCAALLLIIANANRVENNDLSWSGDGVFLGQYQHSNVPNNNYFAYNECSYSPHNAIEATFADGNIYRHNKCNYSHYGLWLGYSFNSVVDSNDIIGNYQSGIAIDRGFNNDISNNLIKNNPIGIELWEGTPATGYSSFHSQDYPIHHNIFEGNTKAVSSINTKHALVRSNEFNYSQLASLYLDGASGTDTITLNTFRMPTGYQIYNNSAYAKFAVDNLFLPSDTALVSAKIFDKHDNAAKGEVTWLPQTPAPLTPLQLTPPCDMAEPAALWYAYPEVGYPAKVKIPDTVRYDFIEKKVGSASVKLVTSRGYDLALNYRPAGDSLSHWALTDLDTLYFWVRTIKQPQYGFQYFSVRIGDDHGGYFKYTASPTLLNNANMVWKRYKFPLSGNSQFARTATGSMSLDHVNYVEIHADTWDYGFTLWVDGMQFEPCSPLTSVQPIPVQEENRLMNYPNPFTGSTVIAFHIVKAGPAKLEVYNSRGTRIWEHAGEFIQPGDHEIECNLSQVTHGSGIFLLKLTTPSGTITKKILLLN
ncbi:MAG: right-handed parallel beta-helix repeat-containing protein [Bacteroidetes bacterium]|nr:right-handed parallel beta-helix repeat-containing protein [Bacteroidota bacterium]